MTVVVLRISRKYNRSDVDEFKGALMNWDTDIDTLMYDTSFLFTFHPAYSLLLHLVLLGASSRLSFVSYTHLYPSLSSLCISLACFLSFFLTHSRFHSLLSVFFLSPRTSLSHTSLSLSSLCFSLFFLSLCFSFSSVSFFSPQAARPLSLAVCFLFLPPPLYYVCCN